MVGGEVVTSTSGSRSTVAAGSQVAWSLLGLVGFALFVVGGTDFLLNFWPARFGNPEWEFGTITGALNSMPASLLGLTLLLASGIVAESAARVRICAIVLLLWAVFLVAMGAIYGLTLPLAVKGFAVPNVGTGLKRAIFRSLVQLVVYPIVMAWMGIRGLKSARSITS